MVVQLIAAVAVGAVIYIISHNRPTRTTQHILLFLCKLFRVPGPPTVADISADKFKVAQQPEDAE